mmetsp:Transcript_85963/g.125782  ORF Transcript_85963/g.125782 Transcript_85963/m.125782 type:complete len:395 (+) Transcript_85963:397-1581(+)
MPMCPQRFFDVSAPPLLGPELNRFEPVDVRRVEKHEAYSCLPLFDLVGQGCEDEALERDAIGVGRRDAPRRHHSHHATFLFFHDEHRRGGPLHGGVARGKRGSLGRQVAQDSVLVGALALGEVGPNFKAAHAADEHKRVLALDDVTIVTNPRHVVMHHSHFVLILEQPSNHQRLVFGVVARRRFLQHFVRKRHGHTHPHRDILAGLNTLLALSTRAQPTGHDIFKLRNLLVVHRQIFIGVPWRSSHTLEAAEFLKPHSCRHVNRRVDFVRKVLVFFGSATSIKKVLPSRHRLASSLGHGVIVAAFIKHDFVRRLTHIAVIITLFFLVQLLLVILIGIVLWRLIVNWQVCALVHSTRFGAFQLLLCWPCLFSIHVIHFVVHREFLGAVGQKFLLF